MTVQLTSEGYIQTKEKLERLNERLREMSQRRDLSSTHMAEVRRSYERMMAQYRQEISLYEARTKKNAPLRSKA